LAFLGRRAAWMALAIGALIAVAPRPVAAQFGLLKKLKDAKDAMSAPDSAARVKDSLAKLQNVSNGDVAAPADSGKGRSLFSRAVSVAGSASDKFEKVTGVSAKDAALVASGAGIAGIAAKKLGVDPTSLATNAMGKVTDAAQKKAGLQAGSPGAMLQGLAAGASGGSAGQAMQQMQALQQAQALQAMQATALKGLGAQKGGAAAFGGMPDAQLMIAFQQEMMQVAADATAGNPVARAKLDGWNALTVKFEADAAPLSAAVSNGDMAAFAKLQALQTTMMREWMKNYGSKRK
jgi:hypothetical protein